MKETDMMWIALALLSGSCAAILAILIKLHLKHINPLFITLLFAIITLIILFATDILTNKVECKLIKALTFKDWIVLIAAGALNSFAFICYVSALKCGLTGCVVALDRLGIVFALILAGIFLQETFTVKAVVGAIMMIFGAFLIST